MKYIMKVRLKKKIKKAFNNKQKEICLKCFTNFFFYIYT